MGKNIVISFPGGRGYEIPVLYFGAKYYEDQGYEKVFIRHPRNEECEFDVLLTLSFYHEICVFWNKYHNILQF